MARKHRGKVRAPKARGRHLWVGFKPYGAGETKPNHYKEIVNTVWDNRHNLPFAWRILNKGVCDGCALGVAGFHDWTINGVHLCTTRLNLLKVNTATAIPPSALDDVKALRMLDGKELRDVGRLAHPMIRRAGDAGFRRVTWDEALGVIADRIRATTPDRLAVYLTARDHQRGLLRRAEGHAVPRHQQRRQRCARLSRSVDRRAPESDRRGGDHLLIHRRDPQRSHRVVRCERRERAARLHEVSVPRARNAGPRSRW